MKRQKRQQRSSKNKRRQRLWRCELLEPRLPLAVDTWVIDLSVTGNVSLFDPNMGQHLQEMYAENPISHEGNVIATSSVPGQNGRPGVNDEPTFTKGADQTVLEDAGGQTVVGWATGLSAGPGDDAGQTLSFNMTGNSNTNPTSPPNLGCTVFSRMASTKSSLHFSLVYFGQAELEAI